MYYRLRLIFAIQILWIFSASADEWWNASRIRDQISFRTNDDHVARIMVERQNGKYVYYTQDAGANFSGVYENAPTRSAEFTDLNALRKSLTAHRRQLGGRDWRPGNLANGSTTETVADMFMARKLADQFNTNEFDNFTNALEKLGRGRTLTAQEFRAVAQDLADSGLDLSAYDDKADSNNRNERRMAQMAYWLKAARDGNMDLIGRAAPRATPTPTVEEAHRARMEAYQARRAQEEADLAARREADRRRTLKDDIRHSRVFDGLDHEFRGFVQRCIENQPSPLSLEATNNLLAAYCTAQINQLRSDYVTNNLDGSRQTILQSISNANKWNELQTIAPHVRLGSGSNAYERSNFMTSNFRAVATKIEEIETHNRRPVSRGRTTAERRAEDQAVFNKCQNPNQVANQFRCAKLNVQRALNNLRGHGQSYCIDSYDWDSGRNQAAELCKDVQGQRASAEANARRSTMRRLYDDFWGTIRHGAFGTTPENEIAQNRLLAAECDSLKCRPGDDRINASGVIPNSAPINDWVGMAKMNLIAVGDSGPAAQAMEEAIIRTQTAMDLAKKYQAVSDFAFNAAMCLSLVDKLKNPSEKLASFGQRFRAGAFGPSGCVKTITDLVHFSGYISGNEGIANAGAGLRRGVDQLEENIWNLPEHVVEGVATMTSSLRDSGAQPLNTTQRTQLATLSTMAANPAIIDPSRDPLDALSGTAKEAAFTLANGVWDNPELRRIETEMLDAFNPYDANGNIDRTKLRNDIIRVVALTGAGDALTSRQGALGAAAGILRQMANHHINLENQRREEAIASMRGTLDHLYRNNRELSGIAHEQFRKISEFQQKLKDLEDEEQRFVNACDALARHYRELARLPRIIAQADLPEGQYRTNFSRCQETRMPRPFSSMAQGADFFPPYPDHINQRWDRPGGGADSCRPQPASR